MRQKVATNTTKTHTDQSTEQTQADQVLGINLLLITQKTLIIENNICAWVWLVGCLTGSHSNTFYTQLPRRKISKTMLQPIASHKCSQNWLHTEKRKKKKEKNRIKNQLHRWMNSIENGMKKTVTRIILLLENIAWSLINFQPFFFPSDFCLVSTINFSK